MLAIRLQRTGRSGNAQFRVIVQDSRFSPTRGRIVAYIGSYDPHTKTAALDSATAAQYLEKGARPSDRVARLFKKEGIKLPAWVKFNEPKKRAVRHPEKRRSTRPADMPAPAPEAETKAPEDTAEAAEPEAPTQSADEQPAPAEAPSAETDQEPKPEEAPVDSAKETEAAEAASDESEPAAEETPADADKPAETLAEDVPGESGQ